MREYQQGFKFSRQRIFFPRDTHEVSCTRILQTRNERQSSCCADHTKLVNLRGVRLSVTHCCSARTYTHTQSVSQKVRKRNSKQRDLCAVVFNKAPAGLARFGQLISVRRSFNGIRHTQSIRRLAASPCCTAVVVGQTRMTMMAAAVVKFFFSSYTPLGQMDTCALPCTAVFIKTVWFLRIGD